MGANARRRREARALAEMAMRSSPRHLLLFDDDGTVRHLPPVPMRVIRVAGAEGGWDREAVRAVVESHAAICGPVPVRLGAPADIDFQDLLPHDLIEWSAPRQAGSVEEITSGTVADARSVN